MIIDAGCCAISSIALAKALAFSGSKYQPACAFSIKCCLASPSAPSKSGTSMASASNTFDGMAPSKSGNFLSGTSATSIAFNTCGISALETGSKKCTFLSPSSDFSCSNFSFSGPEPCNIK